MSQKNYFIAGLVTKSKDVNVLGQVVNLPMSWAEGMIGVMPVFESMATAENYADGNHEVFECLTDNKKQNSLE